MDRRNRMLETDEQFRKDNPDDGQEVAVIDEYDEMRRKGIQVLRKELLHIEQLSHADIQRIVIGGMHKLSACFKAYSQQLNILLRKFRRTTNAKDGKQAFRDDVSILQNWLHLLLEGGMKGR